MDNFILCVLISSQDETLEPLSDLGKELWDQGMEMQSAAAANNLFSLKMRACARRYMSQIPTSSNREYGHWLISKQVQCC